MVTPSINIGIGNKGSQLVKNIEQHFKTHEFDLSKAILSSSITVKDKKHCFEHIKDGFIVQSDIDSVKSWFNSVLYPEINNLADVANGFVDSLSIVNIVVQIEEDHNYNILKELLAAIKTLTQNGYVGVVGVRLFTIIQPLQENNLQSQDKIAQQLSSLEEVSTEFESILSDVYYIDNQNIDAVHLRLDSKWLGFALAEFFVLGMIGPTSMARTGKNKTLGLGVIHFNEGLFCEIIRNKILEYKFNEEGVDDAVGVQLQDIFNKCNPFIKRHQDFFQIFINGYPFCDENDQNLERNTNNYIKNFKIDLDSFITDEKNNIGESKAILANLLGEDDEKLEGVDWKSERLTLKDLEFDIINYFNQFLDENDQVDLLKEKVLREQITDLKNGIKKGNQSIKKIDDISQEIHRDLEISFEKGVFSIDGKRINASGYIPSPINPNDEIYSFNDKQIPKSFDLSPYLSPVKDQGQLGSCTAFPIAAVYEFAAIQNNNQTNISELFIYYNARALRGNIDEDSGATLLDAINGVKENGACMADVCPYNVENFNKSPDDNAFVQAKHQIVEKACRVTIAENDFKHAIANGNPVIFGLKLFQSFYPKNDLGVISYPSHDETSHENHGHHAMLLVGYNDEEKLFKVRNSWGNQFGDKGYCYIPYDYLANPNFCNEAFVIMKIVDLAYNEFDYNSQASFSFLKNQLIRKKTILEYNLRLKNKELVEVKREFQKVALQNEENTIQIKDPLFRKKLLNILKDKTKIEVDSVTISPLSKPSFKKWQQLVGLGVLLVLVSIVMVFFLSPAPSFLVGSFGLILIIWSIINMWKIKENAQALDRSMRQPVSISTHKKDLYIFRIGDRLFDKLEKLDADLITRYRALSRYYSNVQKWKEEILTSLDAINYSSPSFVFNVIEEKPLMDYLKNEKEVFLTRLPNLSSVFHKKYDTNLDNIEEVFNELKTNYSNDIQRDTDLILDVSIAEYLLGKEYPYLNPPPKLDKMLTKLEKVSKPFCNLSSTVVNIDSQHYVLMEKFETDRNNILNRFAVHRNPNITPVIVERSNNRKKYVSIQVASLKSVKSIVRSTSSN